MTTPIKNYLPLILPANDKWQVQLLQKWDSIIGNLKTKIVLEKIQNDTLILGVSDASWLQELFLLSPLIIQAINKQLNQNVVKQLRFKQGTYTKNIIAQKKGAPMKDQAKIVLSRRQEVALQKITDNSLQKALTTFWVRCAKEGV